MPAFRITGRGKTSSRPRQRTARAIDSATAIAIEEADGTLVENCVELPYPQADTSLLDHAAGLGIEVSDGANQPECVFEILRWCIENRRVVSITYLSDGEGHSWRTDVEPHGFRRSKEGWRLRCYRPAQLEEPDVVFDFQTDGWHLYLIEDIERAEAVPLFFEPRPYTRGTDEISISISFRPPAV